MENINALAEKIYQEGIQKAQVEAEDLLAKSEKEAAEIASKAKREAAEIIEKGKAEAENQKKIIQSELRLANQHSMEELKSKVRELVIFQSLNKPAEKLFSDPKFISGLIIEMAKNMDSGNGLLIKFSSEWENQIEGRLTEEIRRVLKGVDFEIDTKLGPKNFRIAEKGKNFEISFSEEDFLDFFQSHLKETTRKLLFD
jgi:V/A-type H+/Na+-transporting ATPase subunit E